MLGSEYDVSEALLRLDEAEDMAQDLWRQSRNPFAPYLMLATARVDLFLVWLVTKSVFKACRRRVQERARFSFALVSIREQMAKFSGPSLQLCFSL